MCFVPPRRATWRSGALLLLLLLLIADVAFADDPTTCWIFLRERPAPAADAPGAQQPALGARSLARRARLGIPLLPGDFPVHAPWVRALEERGIRVQLHSRWLHAVVADVTSREREEVARLSFVRDVRPVARFRAPRDPLPCARQPFAMAPSWQEEPTILGEPAEYGGSFGQLAMLGIPDLHAAGHSGEGVLVAIFDSGFHKDHPALAHLDLVAEHDFVDGDDQTQNWDGQNGSGDYHGTFTLTALAGYSPGALVGPAYRASFALARTEDIDLELRAEEQHYVAALEWADALGADLVSTSLGYRCFPDDGGFCYDPDSLDGRTAVTSVAVAAAAERGLLVVTSAGNEGPGPATINTPADAERCLAVGALHPWGVPTDFSSRGPTADGRVKPDLCAQGSQVVCGRWFPGFTDIGTAAGTSLAAPLIAGLATLLVAQLPDSSSAVDLVDMLREVGTRADYPANDYGYGTPWGPRAMALLTDREVPSVAIDSLAWSLPPAAGVTVELRLRLVNRGTAPAPEGELGLECEGSGVVCDGAPRAISPLSPGGTAWIGPWNLDLSDVSPGWIWTALTAELEFGDETFYRWLPFRLDAPLDPARWVGIQSWPQPWSGDRSLHLVVVRLRGGRVRVDLFDVAGRRVLRLADALDLQPGASLIEFPASAGAHLASGRYLLRVQGSGSELTCPVLRLR